MNGHGGDPAGPGEPIAVIGVSCRLPGADGPTAFWDLLRSGADAVTELAAPRWPVEGDADVESDVDPDVGAGDPGGPGAAGPQRGGFLDAERIEGFDAEFFGVTPREAAQMDPQQRLALELGWEALEDAGLAALHPASRPGSPEAAPAEHPRKAARQPVAYGVFLGVIADDYATLSARTGPATAHTLTGLHRSLVANRISYALGLNGPSLTVDAGQSSSLVSVHLACESLRSGESAVALAGGVNLNLVPETTERITAFGALSPDGRCYTFDERANGYVRGEGGAVLVLKRLSDAVADGDPIRCVLLGSAVNNDGGGPGLTSPHQAAQEDLLRSAYRRAGVAPDEVQYVELHGTGTRVGDPVEARALGTVLGAGRDPRAPLAVGSVKTNVGHLEGAAGVTGLLKLILSVQHRALPPSLNYRRPNPEIALVDLRLRVQTGDEATAWPDEDRPLLGGVSSFGMGGTNCHVVVGEWAAASSSVRPDAALPGAARTTRSPLGELGLVPWPVSARSAAALRGQAERLLAVTEAAGAGSWSGSGSDADAHADSDSDSVTVDGPSGLRPVGRALALSRAAFEHRGVVLAAGFTDARNTVGMLATGMPAAGLVSGAVRAGGSRVALVFPGQGSQWAGMAMELLASSTVFAARMGECDTALAPYLGSSVVEAIREGALDDVVVVQSALWAVMVSLAEVWRAAGVEPGAVIGHSQGEIAAACVAGALSVEDGAKTVALRAKVIGASLSGRGGMLSVGLPVGAVLERLTRWGDRLCIGSVNGPSSTVVSGELDALAELRAACDAEGIRARRVGIDYASHSVQVDAIREEVLDALAGITPVASDVLFYSTVTGGRLDTRELDAAYWLANLRGQVRFDETVRALLADGFGYFVEASAHPVLAVGLAETFEDAGFDAVALGTLRRNEGGQERFLTSLAEGWVRGLPVDWQAVFADTPPAQVALPTYAFQRRRHWVDTATGRRRRRAGTAAAVPAQRNVRDAEHDEDQDYGAEPAPAASSFAARLAALRPAERDSTLLRFVLAHAAAVAGQPSPDALDPEQTFKNLGFDSHLSVQLRNRIAEQAEVAMPATVLFDQPTPSALARHLRAALLDAGPAANDAAAPPVDHPDADDSPIAIVAMACRLPGGVDSPEALWDVVADGRDVIGDFPDNRGWDIERLYDPQARRAATSYVRHGGFLDGAPDFDAGLFGISPREALAMDPQQRLLLETSWEAVERAGMDPLSLRGTRTGVFFGAMFQEYGPQLQYGADGVEGHRLTGTLTSVASGRLAYALGLEGPAVTLDTACSSSLVALHWAVRSLRSGECTMAIAGGVTIMSTPGMFVELSRQGALSPDGRCKAFSAAADGTGWSEGVGVLVVERLSDARRNGHQVLALVRGSATNQDGASNGLTAPHGPSQERVIRDALADARVAAADVDVVEAHGTGTTLGDPIEAQALLATYGQSRPEDRPLRLGSVKSNIGHTQAAAGIAGVIKIVQALRHEELPRTLHADVPSPHVDWSGAVTLLTEPVAWKRGDRPRRAGVSSFGISGTNAHVILEEAEPEGSANPLAAPGPSEAASGAASEAEPVSVSLSEGGAGDLRALPILTGAPAPWPVSGQSAAALRAQAARIRDWTGDAGGDGPASTGDGRAATGRALAATRAVLEHRAVVLAADPDGTRDALTAVAVGAPTPHAVVGAADLRGRTAFVFPGQGSQWRGMAAELLGTSTVFARRFTECEREMAAYVDWSATDVLRAAQDAPPLDRIDVLQPVLFAVNVSLAAMWRAAGVEPGAVVGSSQGEIAAACVAGALTLADAVRIVVLRSALFGEELVGNGAVASVALSAEALEERLAAWDGRLTAAGRNGPTAQTVAGDETSLADFVAACKDEGIRARVIGSTVASHCAQVDPLRDRITRMFADVTPVAGGVPFYSTVTGGALDGHRLDAGYWFENARRPVDFETAVHTLLDDGFRFFVEISAHPVLTPAMQETFEYAGTDALALGTLRRDEGGADRFLTSVAEGWVRGLPGVDWTRLLPATDGRRVHLPTYAFQRTRYWLESAAGAGAGTDGLGLSATGHPMLGAAVQLADSETLLLTGRISLRTHPWLSDHAALGTVLLPGAAFAELALHAAELTGCAQVEELTLEAPLILAGQDGVHLQLTVGAPDATGRRELRIHSRPDRADAHDARSLDTGPWVRHAAGVLASEAPAAPEPLTAWPPADARPVPVEEFYADLDATGYGYGPAFRRVRAAWRSDQHLYADVTLGDEQAADAGSYGVHPALLDAALHISLAHVDGLRLPFAWRGLALHAVHASAVRVRVTPQGPDTVALTLADATGAPVASVEALTLLPVGEAQLSPAGGPANTPADQALFRLDWQSVATAEPAAEWLALGADTGDDGVPDVAELLARIDADTIEAPRTALVRLGGWGREEPRGAKGGLGDGSWTSGEGKGEPGQEGGQPGDAILGDGSGTAGHEDGTPARTPVDAALPARVHAATAEALGLLKTWLGDERLSTSRLVVLTRGAVAAEPGEDIADLATAPVWGLIRSAQSEHPGRLVLVDTDDTPASRDALATAVATAVARDEAQIALRAGGIRLPRLVRATPGAASEAPAAPQRTEADPHGTVLITGGTGALGSLLAGHLVAEHGVRHLVLTSRRGPDTDGAADLRARLRAGGAETVEITACDVADRASLAAVLEAVPSDRPLTGVVHAAGVLDDGLVLSLTDDQLSRVLTPKVDAAVHLHELTRHLDLSLFVLFSSIAATFGNPGQADYAAANAFLDALATRRRAERLPAHSLAWGLWAEVGSMRAHLDDGDLAWLRASGVRPLAADLGLALFDAATATDTSCLVPVSLDLTALRAEAARGSLRPAFRSLVRARRTAVAAAPADSASDLRHRLTGLDPQEQDRLLLELIREQAAAVLALPTPDTISARRSFKEFGFDSLTALQLRNALATATGLRLPATLVFDYPTPQALTGFLRTLVLGADRPGQAAATAPADAAGQASAPDSDTDPVVIVGMACRYPGGVGSPEELWSLVASGGDAVSGFPVDRGWDVEGLFDPNPGVAGRSYAREGGFLYGAGEFDAGFFGVSPREALSMDPQQRLLLEASWEVLERAGIDPGSLRGSSTGVFTGVMHHDYGSTGERPEELEGYAVTSTQGSVASGRVSYTFGFEGPAMTVDTACSSSLVAMHLAAQALRSGECSLALAGGVTVMATPWVFVEFSRQRGMAPDGRSKAFSAAADGAGWGEGVGVLLLERLSDARRNGHRVLAVMRGSAVNQDGASNGLTAPNGPSQERVIRAALDSAGLTAADVDAVEAHGTGTALGDPIEAQALLATYGQGRAGELPLWLGSVKSNIGHTQAAAGVAGVIKMVQAMRHEVLPKSLYADEPTPHVDWSSGAVELLTDSQDWSPGDRPRRAAVSSFGISGTNAHVILEEAGPSRASEPEPEVAPEAGPLGLLTVVPWVVSARSADALRGQAERLAAFVEAGGAENSPADVGLSLATSRTALEHRSVVLAPDIASAVAGLCALADDTPAARVVSGATVRDPGRVVLVFPGQGSQWAGMATELLDSSAVFGARLAECDAALLPYVGSSVVEAIRSGALDDVVVVQGALWAVMVSLAGVWRAAGVEPGAVIGHSQGEIAAACVAGALSVEDAARVVALRAKAIRGSLSGNGGMVSVALPAEAVRERIGRWDGRIGVASVNGPSSTVVSGEPQALDELLMSCEAEGVRARRIDVDYASHSVQVDAICDEVVQALSGITPTSSEVPFYSTVTGGRIDTSTLDAAYWVTNLRQEVRFDETVRALLADGFGYFVESSPHPVLAVGLAETFEDAGSDAVALGTLRRDEGGQERFLTSLAEGWVRGLPVDWRSVFGGTPARPVDLPTYAFQHERYWLTGEGGRSGDPSGLGQEAVDHPLLGAVVRLAGSDQVVFTGRLSLASHAWLGDHRVEGIVLVPGAALAEWALRAADEVGAGCVEELTLQVPLVVPESGGVQVQVSVSAPDEDGRRELGIHSRAESAAPDDRPWTRNAAGTLLDGSPETPDTLTAWPPPGAEPVPVDGFYERAAAAGYGYGPAFQGLRAAWRDGDELYAEVALPEAAVKDAARFGIHPALLDAAIQAVLLEHPHGSPVRLPFAWSDVVLGAVGATSVRVRLRASGPDTLSVTVTDTAGTLVLSVTSLVLRAVSGDQLRGSGSDAVDGLFRMDWVRAMPTESNAVTADCTFVAGAAGLAALATGSEPVPPLVGVVLPPVSVAVSGDVPGAVADAVTGVLGLVQEWLAEERFAGSRLVLVTCGAVSTHSGESVADLVHAPVWGLVRSALAENPGRLLLVDTDRDVESVADLGVVLGVAVASGEPQVAVRGGEVLVPRLVRAPAGGGGLVPPAEGAWRLVASEGTLDGLALAPHPAADAPLAPGQIRVGIRAAGVNFRDVVVSLGMVGTEESLGCEGAGVVVEVGPGVAGVAVGDRVMGLLPESFGPLAVVDERLVVRVPEGWSFEQAAAVPAVFLTAWIGLADLGELSAGQRVLIHAATGGVGMAATQLARHWGAEVFGTASEGKWDTLRDMGFDAEHIASSRTLAFEDAFMTATGGDGVDVVLDCLAREFVDASLRLLPRGGRFLEMGKTDLRDPQAVAAEHPGVTYRAYDLAKADPQRVGEILRELAGLFAEGVLEPLPVRVWDVRRAGEALRFMSQARHVGKVVLRVPRRVDAGSAVLVTGGTGLLGGLVARHMVASYGVRDLVLASRRGEGAPGVAGLVAELEAAGARVEVVGCDVAVRDEAAGLLARFGGDRPLGGVVHCAGALDDGLVPDLDAERIRGVLRAKVDAAWHLHELTRDLDLSLFVLFSSLAGVVGTAGQANYAAANTFLDALAGVRRTSGASGVSMAWGHWATDSELTGSLDEVDRARLARSGVVPMSVEQGIGLFDAALGWDVPLAVTARLAPETADDQTAGEAFRALARGLTSRAPQRRTAKAAVPAARSGGADLAARLAALGAAERSAVLVDMVRTNVAAVLGHGSSAAVDPARAFKELGFDSLTGVELRNRLGTATGQRLAATVVFDHPTPDALAAHLLGTLLPDEQPPGTEELLAELAAFETQLATVAAEDVDADQRAAVGRRLENLLAFWRDSGTDTGSGTRETGAADRLKSASADEVLDFINNELGIS
nr:type I polyketide synthase [Streptomyces sp. CBMA29]